MPFAYSFLLSSEQNNTEQNVIIRKWNKLDQFHELKE